MRTIIFPLPNLKEIDVQSCISFETLNDKEFCVALCENCPKLEALVDFEYVEGYFNNFRHHLTSVYLVDGRIPPRFKDVIDYLSGFPHVTNISNFCSDCLNLIHGLLALFAQMPRLKYISTRIPDEETDFMQDY
jgi:hypothetical protein